jgi:hypothetical protein
MTTQHAKIIDCKKYHPAFPKACINVLPSTELIPSPHVILSLSYIQPHTHMLPRMAQVKRGALRPHNATPVNLHLQEPYNNICACGRAIHSHTGLGCAVAQAPAFVQHNTCLNSDLSTKVMLCISMTPYVLKY